MLLIDNKFTKQRVVYVFSVPKYFHNHISNCKDDCALYVLRSVIRCIRGHSEATDDLHKS